MTDPNIEALEALYTDAHIEHAMQQRSQYDLTCRALATLVMHYRTEIASRENVIEGLKTAIKCIRETITPGRPFAKL